MYWELICASFFYIFTILMQLKLPLVMDIYTKIYSLSLYFVSLEFLSLPRIDMDTMNIFYKIQSYKACSPNWN